MVYDQQMRWYMPVMFRLLLSVLLTLMWLITSRVHALHIPVLHGCEKLQETTVTLEHSSHSQSHALHD